MNKISLALIKIIVFSAISTTAKLVAMEKDEESKGRASLQGFVRQIHPAFTPIFSEKFECFLKSNIITSQHLTSKHSILIRTTIHRVFSIVKFNPFDIAAQQFGDLKGTIGKCIAICKMWPHPSLPLFEAMQQLYLKRSLVKSISVKARLSEIVTTFFENHENITSVDSIELRLISMAYDSKPFAAKVFELCKELVEKQRPELAVYYLLAYARKVPNLKTGRWLCGEARDIEAAQAVKFKAEQDSILESRQAEEQLKAFMLAEWMLLRKEPSDNIISLEAALRCIHQGSLDTKFIFHLTDQLVLKDRKDIAIHSLLVLGQQCSAESYPIAMVCFKKAAQLGSSEAMSIKWQFSLENAAFEADSICQYNPKYLEAISKGEPYLWEGSDGYETQSSSSHEKPSKAKKSQMGFMQMSLSSKSEKA